MDADAFMRILQAARDEDGAFPYDAFYDLFLDVRGRAQWATAGDLLEFVARDLVASACEARHDGTTRLRAGFIARALKEYALQAWKLGPAENDPAALPVEDVLFRTLH